MHVILWVVAGAIALLIAIIAVLAGRRDHASDNPDLGSISGAWLSEHNSSHGDRKS